MVGSARRDTLPAVTIRERLRSLDWSAIEQSLWERGYARTPVLLSAAECRNVIDLYADDRRFRKHIDMARLRFGMGDYMLVESEPRAQSRGEVVAGARGEIVIFPTRERPIRGKLRVRRARMRHGLARLESGSRYALGIIFHDARP